MASLHREPSPRLRACGNASNVTGLVPEAEPSVWRTLARNGWTITTFVPGFVPPSRSLESRGIDHAPKAIRIDIVTTRERSNPEAIGRTARRGIC